MQVTVYPSRLSGEWLAPPSKSQLHRALLCAALCRGETVLSGSTDSEDVQATIGALRELGYSVTEERGSCRIAGDPARFTQRKRAVTLHCGRSASTLRFLLPLCALSPAPATLTGEVSLFARPLSVYEEIFKRQSIAFTRGETCCTVEGCLSAGEFTLPGNISSQFLTGLLLALPQLRGASRITVTPPLESGGYVGMTVQMLRRFGFCVTDGDALHYRIPGNQCGTTPWSLPIEGDCSQAACFAVYAALRGGISIGNLPQETLQPDAVLHDLLQMRGEELTAEVSGCPDLAPALLVLGIFRPGRLYITGTARLRLKECDRLAAMEEVLTRLNIPHRLQTSGTLEITGGQSFRADAPLPSFNDHRMVMAETFIGLMGEAPLTVSGAEAVAKSYPAFFEELTRLHGKITVQ